MRVISGVATSLVAAASFGASMAKPFPLAERAPKNAPICDDPDANPFCTPKQNSDIYVDDKINISWNPDKFTTNSSITVIIQYRNDSSVQAASSSPIKNEIGFWAVKVKDEWKKGFDAFNYSIIAQEHIPSEANAHFFDGELNVTVTDAPARHYPAPEPTTSLDEDKGLKIGLPVGLGALLIVIVGLWIGMRKHRQIGLGNIMSRNRGYDSAKSRRQTNKNGRIRLDERETAADPLYNNYNEPQPTGPYHDRPVAHRHNESLGSLVGEEPRGDNVFRQEIDRQRTGGRF